MNKFQICSHANAHKKIRPLIQTLKPLLSEIGLPCWIAGGVIRDTVIGIQYKDIDIFFPDTNTADVAIDKMLEKGYSSNKINSDQSTVIINWNNSKIELIRHRVYDSAITTLESFDFICCAAAITLNEFICHNNFIQHCENKIMRPLDKKAKISTSRIKTLSKKGFTSSYPNCSNYFGHEHLNPFY